MKKTSTSDDQSVSDNAVDPDSVTNTSSEDKWRCSMEMAADIMATGILRGANTRIEAIFLGSVGNTGTLILDATCCPANIRYPQDFSLLDEAREKLDQIISRICKSTGQKKPRMYCRVARSRYLDLAKKKKRRMQEIRQVIRFMLGSEDDFCQLLTAA